MPSTNQTGSKDTVARNEAHRMLATDMELAPLIRGIEDIARIQTWWNEVNRLGIEGQRRDQVLKRMQYLKEREND